MIISITPRKDGKFHVRYNFGGRTSGQVLTREAMEAARVEDAARTVPSREEVARRSIGFGQPGYCG